jgi:Kef-type K+ transport system membrane component KefB
MSNFQVGVHLFLQLAAVIASCRLVGWLGRKFLGQTQVFMEMVVGVLLGPSLFGLLAPQTQAWLFPRTMSVGVGDVSATITHPNMVILYALAQVGLVLYMFVIGLEFDVALLKGRAKMAGLVSSAGIIVPFIGALAMTPYLMSRNDLFTAGAAWPIVLLFVGASISITAFPMLARILYERGIASTTLGTLTLAAGSIDDAVAWCLLAVVLAVFKATPETAWMTLGGGFLYGLAMMTVGRRLLRKLGTSVERSGRLSSDSFGLVVVVLALCAFLTDLIGIYAVFGAFICGAAMPKGLLADLLTEKVEQLTTSLFLPMFFVYSGLNTKMGLVNTWGLWGVAALVILVSVLCKGAACTVAARYSGENWRQSSMVGILMNARGLMELILLNIGLERGVVTPTFFTIMVLMAVVTTGMASPIYAWLSRGVVLEGARIPGSSRAVRSAPPQAQESAA